MDKYAVIGHPVCHSKSPALHAKFAQQTGHAIVYKKIEAPLNGFVSTVESFFCDPDAKGCNVTLPFKEHAARWVDTLSPRASMAGAVNTIVKREDGKFYGDNTDGVGLVLALNRQGVSLAGRRLLLIGAGGAARGALGALLEQAPASVTIVNRTVGKAADLVQSIASVLVTACSYDKANDVALHRPFDVLINSTSTSLTHDLPPLTAHVFASADFAFDMVYADNSTSFVEAALKHGATRACDGSDMLIGQAAYAFALWRGVMPSLDNIQLKDL